MTATALTAPGTASLSEYPPEPWYLGGRLIVGVHLLPAAAIPAEHAALAGNGVRRLTLGGRVPVGVVFASYAPGGVLAYEELLVAVSGRTGLRPVTTIGQIWVDSPASRAGGRALWGIPKELGRFTVAADGGELRRSMRTVDGAEVASVQARLGRALLPGLRRLPLTTAQRLDGVDARATNLLLGRIRHVCAEWRHAADGPLGWLAGRSPRLTIAIDEAAIVFGQRARRTPST